MTAGEFRAGNSIEPGKGFTGVRINEDGVRAFNTDAQTVGIEVDGDAFFGSDISSAASTGISIFSEDQTYNGESVGAGDVLLGDNTSTKANILWDKSAGQFYFRLGTTVKAIIDADGFTVSFTPTEIADLVYWFDAAVEITKDGSDRVSNWGNQGTASDVQQSTAGRKPLWVDNVINGLPVVRFDEARPDELLTAANDTALNSLSGMTIFTVVRLDSTGTDFAPRISKRTVDGDGSDGGIELRRANAGAEDDVKFGVWTTDPTHEINFNNSLIPDTPQIECAVFDGTGAAIDGKYRYYVGGTEKARTSSSGTPATTTPNLAAPMKLGYAEAFSGDLWLKGDIAEVLVYNKALNGLERRKVFEYLAEKYAL